MDDTKTYPIQPMSRGPRRAKMPVQRAQRWLADGENGRRPQVEVFMTQAAYQRICAHAKSDLDNEVGGWLAGRWCRDEETGKEFVVVEALLPAQQVRSGSTFLTFTHDSQVAMLAALEERYAKKGVVGWYHTHPRMGVFLSGYDVWLHKHFFPQPWQVALVVEPHSGVGGFFVRDQDNQLDQRKYFGFYELRNRRIDSVMEWKNLRPEKQPESSQNEPQAAGEAKQSNEKPLAQAPKKKEEIAPKLERKEFKKLITAPPAANKQTARAEVKSNEVQKNNTKKFEIKTDGSQAKDSEEAEP